MLSCLLLFATSGDTPVSLVSAVPTAIHCQLSTAMAAAHADDALILPALYQVPLSPSTAFRPALRPPSIAHIASCRPVPSQPRRAAIKAFGLIPDDALPSSRQVLVSSFDEKLPHDRFKVAAEYAVETARHKALDVAAVVSRAGGPPADLIISSDTIVEHGGKILEKPADAEDAFRTIKSLSGQRHQVWPDCCFFACVGYEVLCKLACLLACFRQCCA